MTNTKPLKRKTRTSLAKYYPSLLRTLLLSVVKTIETVRMEGHLTPLTAVHCPLFAGLADPVHLRLEDEVPPIVKTNSLQVGWGKPSLGLGLPRRIGEGLAVGNHHQLYSLPDELQQWHVLHLLPLLLHHLRQGCRSAFISSGSGSSILGWIPIRIQGFNEQKLRKKITAEKKINFFFDQKRQFTYP